MHNKSATTGYPIHPLLRERWSPRAFAARPVPHDDVLRLLEAARWAPSSGNGQPWRFVLAPQADPDAFGRALESLNAGNVVWAQHAPLLILAAAQMRREDGAPNRTALYDLGQAVAHLSVQATALGLWIHQIGGFDQPQARELFAIPEGYEPVTWIAIGELGDYETLPEPLRERERAPRARQPLEAFVFGGGWGRPAPLLSLDAEANARKKLLSTRQTANYQRK
jgi:nitroreductase